MSLLLLVRHGQASWGTDDYDALSEHGARQSRVLGEELARRGHRPHLVVAGGMRRHRETAREVLAGAGWAADVDTDPGWDELDHRQLLERHATPHAAGPRPGDPRRPDPDGAQRRFEEATLRWTGGAFADEYDETFPAFCARVDGALRRTAQRLGSGQTAVVLTSGGPVSWVAADLLAGEAELWRRLVPVVVNASVTKVVVGQRGTTLVSFNDHGHLEGPDGGLVTYR